MTDKIPHGRTVTLAVATLLLVAGWFLYAPALDGGYALDDRSNLRGLAAVDDLRSALRFTFGGDAGPLGRPVALASFLPQAGSYAGDAAALMRVNVLVHLLNAALLMLLFGRLAGLLGLTGNERRFTALAAAATWLVMPLLASASLMIIQRMTTLATTFMIAALIAYLAARARAPARPRAALAGMTAALVVGTLVAVLTKEIGALLPTLVLVVEATLLRAPDGIAARSWRRFRLVALALPTLAIAAYLLLRLPYPEATLLWRDFSGWERLLSEARILWLYLAKAFLPLPGFVTPVNDAYAVSRSLFEPLTLAAVLGWLAVAAFALAWRRRFPLASFAALWFLAGHLLESTTIPLELYFDHRNYLPLIGPVFALVAALARLPRRLQRPVRAGLALYAAALSLSLFQLTTLWGQPDSAAAAWYRQHPGSVRAAMRHAERQLSTEGVGAALGTVSEFVSRNPEHAYLLIQDLNIRCRLDPAGDFAPRVAALEAALGQAAATHTAGTMLSELAAVARRHGCRGLEPPALRALARALRDNPRYRGNPVYGSVHEQFVALTYRMEGRVDETLRHLDAASRLQRGREAVMLKVVTLAENGRYGDARDAIATARGDAPLHPVRRWLWHGDLDELAAFVTASEESSGEKQ